MCASRSFLLERILWIPSVLEVMIVGITRIFFAFASLMSWGHGSSSNFIKSTSVPSLLTVKPKGFNSLNVPMCTSASGVPDAFFQYGIQPEISKAATAFPAVGLAAIAAGDRDPKYPLAGDTLFRFCHCATAALVNGPKTPDCGATSRTLWRHLTSSHCDP